MSELPPDAAAQRAVAVGEDEETASTGVPAADEAAARLRAVDDAPIDKHVEIYEDTHRRLEEGLADLDER